MRNAWTIARREFASLFHQPLAWVFLAVFLGLSAAIGLEGFFTRGVADLRDYVLGLRWTFAILAPAVAMRLWSDEGRRGTLELLFTLPVRPWEATLGKFLAGLTLLGGALLLGVTLPLSLSPWASFDWGQVAAGYLGAFGLAATYLAVGLLASAATHNQVVAFLTGALACLALGLLGDPWAVEQLGRHLPDAAVRALASLGAGRHFDALARGVLDLRDLAYFLAVVATALFLNTLAVERREGRGLERPLAGALALVVLGLWIDVTGRLPARLDLTSERRNTLSPTTLDLLDQARDLLTVRAYLSPDLKEAWQPQVRAVEDLLADLAAAGGPKVRVEVIRPDTEALRLQAQRDGVVPVEIQERRDGRFEAATYFAGVALLHADRPPATIPMVLNQDNLEYALARRLQRLVLPTVRVGFAGPGAETYGHVQAALRDSYGVQTIDLSRTPAVPDAVQVLVYTAPTPPPPRDVYALDQYLLRGGRLIVLAEGHAIDGAQWRATPYPTSPFHGALRAWGLELTDRLVAAPPEHPYGLLVDGAPVQAYYPWFLEPTGDANPTSPVAADLGRLFLQFATEVHPRASSHLDTTPLLELQPAWALPGPRDIHPARPPQQLPTPDRVTLAAATRGRPRSAFTDAPIVPWTGPEQDPLETPLREAQADTTVVLFGDADFARDGLQPRQANQGAALLLSVIEWCLDRELGDVRARGAPRPLAPPDTWTADDRERWAWGANALALPSFVLLLGAIRLAWRRWRSARRAHARRRAAQQETP